MEGIVEEANIVYRDRRGPECRSSRLPQAECYKSHRWRNQNSQILSAKKSEAGRLAAGTSSLIEELERARLRC